MAEKYIDLTNHGEKVELNKDYLVDISDGILIIAFPDENADVTNFEFAYSLTSGIF